LDDAASRGANAGLKAMCERLRASLDQLLLHEEAYPSPDSLSARNAELQGLLVDVGEALHEPSAMDDAAREETLSVLRALFRRMLERQLQLVPPPPARR